MQLILRKSFGTFTKWLVLPIVCLLTLFIVSPARAQVTVIPLSSGQITVPDMVDELITGGGTVEVLSTAYTGTQGSAGLFNGGNEALGFSSGIVLSTGLVANLVGSIRPSTQNGQPGSPEYFSGTTSDAAVLSFSFVPTGDKLSFRLRFLTIEGFGSVYNDAFGIFVNGTDAAANVARLPNGNPVTVSNISVNGPYYESGALLGLNDFYKIAPRGSSIILQADAVVIPNQVNTIAFAIADARDSRVDSVVLIEAGTFFSNSTPQVLKELEDQTVSVGSKLYFQVPEDAFSDADQDDLLTYTASFSLGAGLPSWLSFDPSTRVLSGSPSKDDVGIVNVRIRATDTRGASAFNDLSVTVEDVPPTPTATATSTPSDNTPVSSGTVISGRVIGDGGVGVSNVLVYIREVSIGAVLGSARTSQSGEFSIGGALPNERYSLTLSRTGFAFPVSEALPGIPVLVSGQREASSDSACKRREFAPAIERIHSLVCGLRTQLFTGASVESTKTNQARRRVQRALDTITVWLDDVPEIVLQCRVVKGCTQIDLARTLKRLTASVAAFRRSALGYAGAATTGSAGVSGNSKKGGRLRLITRVHTRVMKAIARLPSSTFRCAAPLFKHERIG